MTNLAKEKSMITNLAKGKSVMTNLANDAAIKSSRANPINFEKIIYHISLFISIFSVLYILSVFVVGYSWLPIIKMDIGSESFMLSLMECLIGALALHAPMIIKKLTKIDIPDMLKAFFYIFVVCATVLGEMFSLYYEISFWDVLLHFGSGIMAGMLGSIIVSHYFQAKNLKSLLSPMFVAIAAVCFSLLIGVVWEIFEFSVDYLFSFNMQKCLLQDGTALIGKLAVADTMKDLIVDFAGAIIAALAAHSSLKNKKGWLYSYKVA